MEYANYQRMVREHEQLSKLYTAWDYSRTEVGYIVFNDLYGFIFTQYEKLITYETCSFALNGFKVIKRKSSLNMEFLKIMNFEN